MRIKNKIIAIVLIGITAGSCTYAYTIKSKDDQTTKIETTKEQPENERITDINIDRESIVNKINNMGTIVVLKGTTNVTSSIDYTEPIKIDNTVIAKPTITKKASCKVNYQYLLDLSKCDVVVEDDTISIHILDGSVYLDKDSIQIVPRSIKLDTKESKMNFTGHLTMVTESIYSQYKETMDSRAQKALEEEIIEQAPNYIDKVYNAAQMKKYTYKAINSILESMKLKTDIKNIHIG